MTNANDPQETARQALRSWGSHQREQAGKRDQVVIDAVAAGLTKEEIHIATGLGRSTIDRIIAKEQKQ
jgi:DNA invertase Pin-like site-specific DNA recombinase